MLDNSIFCITFVSQSNRKNMTQEFKSAQRAANLQYIVSKAMMTFPPKPEDSKQYDNVKEAFMSTFPMGQHLWGKLHNACDCNVASWLRSLDTGNEKLFFESDNFNFLN